MNGENSIARIEPDNNILSIVRTFSRRRRGLRLVVVGRLDADNPYHRAVRGAASDEVLFSGAIYDRPTVRALRFHARAYLHGHTVGGTNPSLVESLWAGNAVIAHANVYNAWTAGPAQFAFHDEDGLEAAIALTLGKPDQLAPARRAARLHAARRFEWQDVLARYEAELLALAGPPATPAPTPKHGRAASSEPVR